MDPREALIELLAEITVGHIDGAAEHAEDLARWVARGGDAAVVTDCLKVVQGTD